MLSAVGVRVALVAIIPNPNDLLRWALMLTAVAYVWPTSPLQQLRAALCVVLLGAMRLLNLAVPILYRDVVNTFRRGNPWRRVSTGS